METDNMEAGQELDALVAEKVMGLELTGDSPIGIRKGGWVLPIPKYSTDIAAAWEIVEKIKATSSRGYVLDFLRGKWTVGLRACGDAGEPELYSPDAGRAEEAPLAICRAALKAQAKAL